MIQGRDGNLYGISANGGTQGLGAIFKATPGGAISTLYSFCTQANCIDGANPFGVLTLGVDGNYYGSTQNGGAVGFGTLFRITPRGSLTVLHSFDGTDGSYPAAGVAIATDGNYYGTTSGGGTIGGGTVFRLTSGGVVTTIHSFDGSDGQSPIAPLVQGSDAALYGTTVFGGGSSACSFGCGTVFRITTSGKFTTLHTFNFTDGGESFAPLVQAPSGAFYGTTFEGGNANSHGCTIGCGTIFKVSAQGAFATVHKFRYSDGGNPESGLALGSDGALYGESIDAGAGNIYKLTLHGTVSTLYNFTAASQGGGTTAMVQATDGKFYGTYGVPGAVFSLDTGLAPFVAFVIPTGKVGQKAQILGQGLTGTTSVTFNGVPATSFSVVSDTYMTAVVPSGATTGSVVVTTPSGTLTSNVSFRISK